MNAFAEFLGEHAVAALLVVAAVVLLFTALAWHLIQRYSGPLWRVLSALVGTSRSLVNRHAPRISMPPVLSRVITLARYLGIQALIGVAVCIAAFGLFFEIADEVGADEDFGQFDVALTASLNANVSAPVLEFFSLITHLGDRNFLIVLASCVALILLWRRLWLHAGAWIVATSLGGALNWVLKALFERTRPEHEHLGAVVSGWSFPSGHASGSFIVYGLLGYIVVRHTPRIWHVPAAMLAVALVVFVGFSRVILQVHYLSDVLAGYAFAAAWVAMWIAGLEAQENARALRTSPADPSASRYPPA